MVNRNTISLYFHVPHRGNVILSPYSLQRTVAFISPTFIIIKTDTNRVFGGYTEHKWNIKNDGHDKDDNAFVFSLDNKQKYDVIDSDHAVVERENYIQFGAPCFVINNNCNKTQNLSVGSSYRTNKFCLSGKRNYKVKDYEVHLIEY